MDRLFPCVSDEVATAALGMTVERFKLAKDTLFESKKRGMMGIYHINYDIDILPKRSECAKVVSQY